MRSAPAARGWAFVHLYDARHPAESALRPVRDTLVASKSSRKLVLSGCRCPRTVGPRIERPRTADGDRFGARREEHVPREEGRSDPEDPRADGRFQSGCGIRSERRRRRRCTGARWGRCRFVGGSRSGRVGPSGPPAAASAAASAIAGRGRAGCGPRRRRGDGRPRRRTSRRLGDRTDQAGHQHRHHPSASTRGRAERSGPAASPADAARTASGPARRRCRGGLRCRR